jgi:uncharacterized protein YrrD
VLRSVKELFNCQIKATDDFIGHLHDVFFDDNDWRLRYFVVDTGFWLPGKKVLVTPEVVRKPDDMEMVLPVDLTREQVRNSPPVDADQPANRLQELKVHQHYSWPIRWGSEPPTGPLRLRADPHLRSSRDLLGYYIEAIDGDIGHVEDFVCDDKEWTIRYLVVDTRNWWPGRKVLVALESIAAVRPDAKHVSVDLTREAIKESPPYDRLPALNRESAERHEERRGRPRYWA